MCLNVIPLLNHRSISLLMLPILLTACINQERTSDCKEYNQAIRKIGQQAAENLQATPMQSGRQSYGSFFRLMAEGEQQNAQIFKSMKLSNPKAQQIQSGIVKAVEEVSQTWQDQATVLDSLPNNSNKAARDMALQPLKPNQSAALRKLSTEFGRMGKYCKGKR
jgi:ATP-dependent Clp protease ATP-binding subunit ClpA